MNILIYKRTHNGDPGPEGIFGINDCMGRIRGLAFDAVLGIGGKYPDPGSEAIALKINWIGIGPKPIAHSDRERNYRGPMIGFEHFEHFFENGKSVIAEAPRLYERMFLERRARYVFSKNLPEDIQAEVHRIIEGVRSKPPSNGFMPLTKTGKGCCSFTPK